DVLQDACGSSADGLRQSRDDAVGAVGRRAGRCDKCTAEKKDEKKTLDGLLFALGNDGLDLLLDDRLEGLKVVDAVEGRAGPELVVEVELIVVGTSTWCSSTAGILEHVLELLALSNEEVVLLPEVASLDGVGLHQLLLLHLQNLNL